MERKVPGLSFLRVWDCEAYVKRLQTKKLASKAKKCFFIGYPKETRGYYFYRRHQKKAFVAKDSTFLEKDFFFKKVSGSNIFLEEIRDAQQMDVDQSMLEAELLMPLPMVEEMHKNA